MNGRAWTPDDSQTLRRLVQAGHTTIEIGDRMDRHRNIVAAKIRQLGLVPGQSPALSAMMMRLKYRRRLAQART